MLVWLRRQMRNAVGSMGTALTHEHMKQLRHSLGDSGTIVVCLDGDAAGLRAVERACREVFLALDADKRYGGITVKIAALPAPFKDPADFCMVSNSQSAMLAGHRV